MGVMLRERNRVLWMWSVRNCFDAAHGMNTESLPFAAGHAQQRTPPISDRRCDVLRSLVVPAMQLAALLASNRYGPL